MGGSMTICASIVIPTCGRVEKLRECIRLLGRQSIPSSSFEVLIGVDGQVNGLEERCRSAWTGPAEHLHFTQGPKRGQAWVRNQLLRQAQGETLIFLNDDMRPEPMLVAAHVRAQASLSTPSQPTIVVGDSPWIESDPDRLFDRLVRDTSMVFFYDQMRDAPDALDRDWGFRHAWMLNLSIPRRAVEAVGGLTEFPSTYGYEDDELAWRLAQRFGSEVRYRPDAVAWHDHRYEPMEYLTREYRLGYAALGFAAMAPECARALFKRDLLSPAERAYTEAFVEREQSGAQRALGSFLQTASMPGAFVDGPFSRELLDVCYSQHLPLKRWCWRSGLLDALRGEAERADTPRVMLAA